MSGGICPTKKEGMSDGGHVRWEKRLGGKCPGEMSAGGKCPGGMSRYRMYDACDAQCHQMHLTTWGYKSGEKSCEHLIGHC